MANIYDIKPNELIEKTAVKLKELIKAPEWSKFVKTGMSKERPPVKDDWWYTRAAAVLRKVYIKGPLGVNKLRKEYQGKKNRGHKPERVYLASGKVTRTILQQLEKAELIKKGQKGAHKGRIIAPKGQSFLDNLSKK